MSRRAGRAEHRAIRKHRARLETQAQDARDLRWARLNREAKKRTRACERKNRYNSEEFARMIADKVMAANPGRAIEVYPCRYCEGYHLTHQEVTP